MIEVCLKEYGVDRSFLAPEICSHKIWETQENLVTGQLLARAFSHSHGTGEAK
jgi:hypothetical protein